MKIYFYEVVVCLQKQLHCVEAAEWRERRSININNLLHGHYSVRVRCTSVAGPGPWTSASHFHVARSSTNYVLLPILNELVHLLFYIVCLVAVFCKI